ncbi:hypothetical protein B0T25DRAFT_460307 [Lasiosphaeria hispida]|uniref:Cyclin-dependent kinase n=1 Tax=Lasiosphaeria hispida TaxID=260671 RepID=A0AAJ0HAY9_9PEZI|nr:hypothetical protein B0T25DRAFT_460307 [Lasiosphaeria hispida]
MSSPAKKHPEMVADRVMKRLEISKMAWRLQNRLALAQFKTKHGWEDLTLDTIEPKVEEQIRRKRHHDGDVMSDSSSSASDLPYPTRALMSSPLKAPFFSDAIGSSNGSTGHRKRTYVATFDDTTSSPSKRFRHSPTAHRSFTTGHTSWKDHHQLAQSSPIKPRRQQHFTTSTGPDVSFFAGSQQIAEVITSPPNYAANSDEDEDLLPAHSFRPNHGHASPPRTPPMRSRAGPNKKNKDKSSAPAATAPANETKSGEEGADLLLYLAASPSPANPPKNNRMEPPSTPPPKNRLALPSSMMTTPGGGNPFLNTPGLAFDFSDFVHMTPSPAQKSWKTPSLAAGGKTPLSIARRRLTFDDLT